MKTALAWGGYATASALAGPILSRGDARKLREAGFPPSRVAERQGWASALRPRGPLVWLHAVSVGEALSVMELAHALSATATVLLTTTSATSARMVEGKLPEGALHQFAPIDTPRAVARFLNHWRPDLMVLTESELWPRQITRAHDRGIPVALVGARMSDRSLARWSRAGWLARHVTARLDLVLAQDVRTARGLVALGAPEGRVEVVGSLKSAAAPLSADGAELDGLRAAIGGRPVWAAASTHDGEEAAVAAAHRDLRALRPDLLLILAPRHPERGPGIAEGFANAGWRVARRGAGEAVTPETDVYVADTLGELGLWFRLARVSFVGGSLVERGGHNPLEPVRLGSFAITGPHVTNFADAYAALEATGAARRVADAGALADAVAPLVDTAARPALPDVDGGPDPVVVAERLLSLRGVRPRTPLVIAPNLKRRLSGVTSTVVRLVPLQAQRLPVAAAGPVLPDHVPQVPLGRLPLLRRRVRRVWHARRNVEMIAGIVLRYLLGKNLALMFTSASQRDHTWLTRALIGQMDAVVATSERSAGYLTVPATVIRHGIDTAAFAPTEDRAALRARLGLPATGPIVGCFGRIRTQKGTDVFVEAAEAALPEGGTALVMGRAVEKDRAFHDALVARAGPRVRFLPEVPVDRTAEWYAALDLYVAPQRWEGFGLTPLEAMACGVPVIATRVGAFEEIVTAETGALVPPDDATAMATAMRRLLSDPERLARMGDAARAHVTEHFTLEGEADALVAIYERLLAE